MKKFAARRYLLVLAVLGASAMAQSSLPAPPPAPSSAPSSTPLAVTGTLVIVPAYGEVRQANDEVQLTLLVEEQDKDKAAAASRVNLKMRQGAEIVRREDPQAQLKTRGYFTYPVYADEAVPAGQRKRQPVSWRVGHYLEVTTKNLASLPKMVAAAQRTMALSGVNFGLSEAAMKRLDEQRIVATYQNLNERIGSIAKAMGRRQVDAVIDTIDFEGSGAYAPGPEAVMGKANMRATMAEPAAVEEPSFEPGETSLQMKLVAKIRFK